MSSYLSHHLQPPPPPPPGYQLVYVPPHISYSSSPSQHQSHCHPHLSRTRSSLSTTTLPSTPESDAAQLPTPSGSPMSIKRCSDLATDHNCILRTYELKMRQQPVQARMCGVGDKSDRRPVDPTPIIQLKVIDHNGEDVTPVDPRVQPHLRKPPSDYDGESPISNPYYFLFACLVGGEEQEDELHVIDDGKTRFLTGTPVSSLYHLKDLDSSDAAFFVFPDLGVRKEGRYKLKLTLFETVDQEVYYCTTMYTSTFSVYSAKKFPGMSKATDLSVSFADQGLKIRVRKDPRQPARHSSIGANKPKRKSDTIESDKEEIVQGPPKRSRGLSMGYPESEQRMHPPPEHHYYTYGHGYPPHPGYYPQLVHGMPPPPPPSAYDPYRGHPRSQPIPQSYVHPPGYYGSSSGRPSTHPSPGPSRHHHSLPPPGYGPDLRSPIPSPSSHGHHTYPPMSVPYPPIPIHEYDRTGVPWPQDRRHEASGSRPTSHGHSHGHRRSQSHVTRHAMSPRSRTSPMLVRSPETGVFRPASSSSIRENERERSPMVLPPLTRSPRQMTNLPPIVDPREREYDEKLQTGSDESIRLQESTNKSNKMGLGNLLG
nr:hypothetical protein L203_04436 [Cryptococcus depauperatus CBS 7841]